MIRICYNGGRKFLVSVPKEGHPNIFGNRDTAGLILGVQSEPKSTINTHFLKILEVEITSCRCWFCTWCALQGVSRLFVCCKNSLRFIGCRTFKFRAVSIVNPFQANVPFPYLLKTSESLYFFMFSGRIEIDYWHEIV